MSKRSVIVGSLGGLVALVMGHGAALANAEWCVSDPPLQVVTPGGQNLMVNNMVYLALSSQGSQQGNFNTKGQTAETATVAPDGHGGTLITVRIAVADGVQQARVVSSVNRFQVSSQGTGSSGGVFFLQLDVPIA